MSACAELCDSTDDCAAFTYSDETTTCWTKPSATNYSSTASGDVSGLNCDKLGCITGTDCIDTLCDTYKSFYSDQIVQMSNFD